MYELFGQITLNQTYYEIKTLFPYWQVFVISNGTPVFNKWNSLSLSCISLKI